MAGTDGQWNVIVNQGRHPRISMKIIWKPISSVSTWTNNLCSLSYGCDSKPAEDQKQRNGREVCAKLTRNAQTFAHGAPHLYPPNSLFDFLEKPGADSPGINKRSLASHDIKSTSQILFKLATMLSVLLVSFALFGLLVVILTTGRREKRLPPGMTIKEWRIYGEILKRIDVYRPSDVACSW